MSQHQWMLSMTQMSWLNFLQTLNQKQWNQSKGKSLLTWKDNDITLRGGEGDKSSEQILNIKIDSSSAARIIVNIEGQDKEALVDTGAGRCCMNEEQYQALGSPPLEPADVGFRLRTACGALMPGMGFLTCNLQIGRETYRQQFFCLPTINTWNYFRT